ncbi:STAS domain-containing protein [Pontibacillus salicampi]|uniref:STAS domain-containing protein n=2 Tax=Pontibacillus salicampi TaxID=1449801 RepID=A0ABV6LRX9_9BACI
MQSNQTFHYYQQQIQTHSQPIAVDMYKLLRQRFSKAYLPDTPEEEQRLQQVLQEMVEKIAKHFNGTDEDLKQLSEWGEHVGNSVLKRRNEQSLSDYLAKLSVYKEALWRFIEQQAKHSLQAETTFLSVYTQIDNLFNHIVYGYSEAFHNAQAKEMESYEEKYLKLSTPIVPIMEHVAILPIIGEMDEKRANVLIDETLKEANQLDIDWLVIDMSGVYHVDDQLLHHFQRLLDSLNIIGLTPILTGMRPELSMRAVQAGMKTPNSNQVKTMPNLKQAVQLLKDYAKD